MSAFALKNTKKAQKFSHPAAKTKPKSSAKRNLKPRTKTKAFSARLKVHSSGSASGHQDLTASQTSQLRSRFKSKSRKQKRYWSEPPKQRSRTQLRLLFKSKPSKRGLSQYQNVSQMDRVGHPTPNLGFEPPQSVWDTSVQAAIRVGDWKLLTGDPGHGEWVPPQVPTPTP